MFAKVTFARSGLCGGTSELANVLLTFVLDLSFSTESVWQHPEKLCPFYSSFMTVRKEDPSEELTSPILAGKLLYKELALQSKT